MKFKIFNSYILMMLCLSCTQVGVTLTSSSVTPDNPPAEKPPIIGGPLIPEPNKELIPESNIELSNDEVTRSLRRYSSLFQGKPLSQNDQDKVNSQGANALNEIAANWRKSNFISFFVKQTYENILGSGGSAVDKDHTATTNLLNYVVRSALPATEILTANYCVNKSGQKVNCDNNVPFQAGVLTGKGFLKSNVNNYNIKRALVILEDFLCLHIPLNEEVNKPIARNRLIKKFSVSSEEELDEEDRSNFLNGANCYACHGHFASFAQLFVKFDDKGNYVSSADGQQSSQASPGQADNGLFTSHYKSVADSSNESTVLLNRTVQNLQDASKVIVGHKNFNKCMIKNLLFHLTGKEEQSQKIVTAVSNDIYTNVKEKNELTFQDIVEQIIKNKRLMKWFTQKN